MLSSGDTPPPRISTRLVADRQQKGTCDCADCASLSALPLCPAQDDRGVEHVLAPAGTVS
jgi:hypothetical protein